MSKEMREQINKVKNFGQFLNEDVMGTNKYYELLDNILNSGIDREFAEDDLKYKIKSLKEIKKKSHLKLYRIIFVKDKNNIDYVNLGHHFVENPYDFHEEMVDYLYGNAKKENSDINPTDVWLVTVSTPTNNIDYDETLLTYSLHPNESEITILNPTLLKLEKVDSFYED
jgi:hypothetical protein